jgi:hypothetical protein
VFILECGIVLSKCENHRSSQGGLLSSNNNDNNNILVRKAVTLCVLWVVAPCSLVEVDVSM